MKRLLLLILFLVMVVPVVAQDATAEAVPTVEAGEVTIIDGEGEGTTVITVEAPETPVETPATNVLSVSNILSFLIGGIVSAAGVIAFIGTQARNAMNDPAKMVLAERLGDSVPQETANKLIEGLNNVVDFLKEATDRQPALLKPSPSSNVSSTGADFSSTAPRMP